MQRVSLDPCKLELIQGWVVIILSHKEGKQWGH